MTKLAMAFSSFRIPSPVTGILHLIRASCAVTGCPPAARIFEQVTDQFYRCHTKIIPLPIWKMRPVSPLFSQPLIRRKVVTMNNRPLFGLLGNHHPEWTAAILDICYDWHWSWRSTKPCLTVLRQHESLCFHLLRREIT